MLIPKQGEEHKAATKGEEYNRQYHWRTRILIIDDEPGASAPFDVRAGYTAAESSQFQHMEAVLTA